jgi:hypothetical protein
MICRFEMSLLNYYTSTDDIESFSLDQGPLAKWTLVTPDFDQEWLKILQIGRRLEEAEKRVFAAAIE